MKIEIKRLELHKVAKFNVDEKDSFFKQVQTVKELLLRSGAYTTSPIIYRYNTNLQKMELFFQITQEVDLNKNMPFDLMDEVLYQKCLFVRYIKENESYEDMANMVRKYTNENNVLVDDPFLVLIQIPGGNVLDMYWPIKEQ